ncbi:MAG: helicase-related protein, partial [Desulfuromusa sp.]
NFDMPDTTDAYIHRIGRTGRAARTGKAFTMVSDDDKFMVRSIERALGAQIDRHRLDGFDYAVPAPKRTAQPARRPARPVPRAKSQRGNKTKQHTRSKIVTGRQR